MSYNKHKWVNNVDAVDEDKMNHIENGIKDLDDNKVNKSGDTLTGGLMFENTDVYDVLRKNRIIDGENYQLSIGLGANASSRMELVGPNGQTLCYVEVRSDGIYNGKNGNKLIESKNSIEYQSWHSIVLTRSDNDYLNIMLYGSNILKEGTYSIANDFSIQAIGTTNSTLTIPKSAIKGISRRDWGFELVCKRSGISGIASTQYNGIAIVTTTIRLQST